MVFNEEKAREIISRFNLDEKTLKVWKSRNAIPDKYFHEGFEIKPKAEGERDEQGWRDIQRILGYGKINIKSIARLMNIDRVADIMYKNIIPTKDEVLAFKKGIKLLRIEAIEIVSLFNQNRVSEIAWKKLKAFLSRKEIKSVVLFNDRVGNKMLDWTLGKRSTPTEYQNEIIQALAVFITETNMITS